MKKKNIVLITVLILSISISIFFGLSYVKADSGWDYDYDSDWGSDWDYDYDYDSDWGSDWDYDWSYSGSSGSSYNGDLSPFFVSILIGTIICIIIVFTFYNTSNNRTKNKIKIEKRIINDPSYYSLLNNYKSGKYSEVSESEVLSKLGMSSYKFRQLAFNIYKNIQNAWTEFDYKKLHKYTTDEIYNSYIMQLDTLKLKNQKNIMESIECIDAKIYNIKEENGILNVDVYLNIRMFDYITNNNGHVVRGTSKRRVNIEYEITFVKTNKKSTKKATICPNCGANIPATTGGKCEYCGSIVVIDAKDFVMSRKTCINQRME